MSELLLRLWNSFNATNSSSSRCHTHSATDRNPFVDLISSGSSLSSLAVSSGHSDFKVSHQLSRMMQP